MLLFPRILFELYEYVLLSSRVKLHYLYPTDSDVPDSTLWTKLGTVWPTLYHYYFIADLAVDVVALLKFIFEFPASNLDLQTY
jgi:hypothetical protein